MRPRRFWSQLWPFAVALGVVVVFIAGYELGRYLHEPDDPPTVVLTVDPKVVAMDETVRVRVSYHRAREIDITDSLGNTTQLGPSEDIDRPKLFTLDFRTSEMLVPGPGDYTITVVARGPGGITSESATYTVR